MLQKLRNSYFDCNTVRKDIKGLCDRREKFYVTCASEIFADLKIQFSGVKKYVLYYKFVRTCFFRSTNDALTLIVEYYFQFTKTFIIVGCVGGVVKCDKKRNVLSPLSKNQILQIKFGLEES